MSNTPEQGTPQAVNVNVNVQRERHLMRNSALVAAGAVLAYALHGCEGSDDAVRHGEVHAQPYAAMSYVHMPVSINAVRAEHATGRDESRIFVASCTPKIPNPFGKDPQACTGDVGMFNGDTGAEIDGKLTLVAYNKSMFVTYIKDKSDFGYHALIVVNNERFGAEMDDPTFTNDALHKGVGNSLKEVAEHKFEGQEETYGRELDEADYLNWLNQRVSDAVKTACVPKLIEYVPASVRKIAMDWILGGIVRAKSAEDTVNAEWLAGLAKEVPHEIFLPDKEYNAMLEHAKTGRFVKNEESDSDTSATIETISANSNVPYQTTPDAVTGISIAVPVQVEPMESYTFTIMGGMKKFTEEVYTDSENCNLSAEDQAKLDMIKQSGKYVIDSRRQQRGGF